MSTAIKQKKVVPELRFSGFDGEWKNKTLGASFEIKSASRVLKDEWTKEGVPFFRSSDVVSSYKGTENSKAFISHKLYERLSKKSGKVSKDDMLVTGGGSIGIPYLITSSEPLYFKDADLLWFKSSNNLNGFFLYTYLRTEIFRRYLKSISHIGTISHYTIEQAKATPIILPELTEQQKIADFLGSVDAWLDNLRGQKTALQSYKQGMMQKLFTGQVRFKDEVGKSFPDWEEKQLGEVTTNYNNKRVPIASDSRSAGDFPYYGANGVVDFVEEYIFDGEYVLVAEDGVVDVTKYPVHLTSGKFWVNNHAHVLEGIEVSNKFLYYYLQQLNFTRYISGSAQSKLNAQVLRKIPTSVPAAEEQQKIADFLTALDQTITAKADEITKVEEWKKGLMQKMFV